MTTELSVIQETMTYTFHVQKKKDDENNVTYYVGIAHSGPNSCMIVEVSFNNAYIHGVSHYPDCSVNRKLRNGSGTLAMIKGTLLYILQQHTGIESVHLTDKATKFLPRHNKKIHITPRRLLLGYEGWYQEHIGAQPTALSRTAIDRILNKVQLDEVDASWGSYEDIHQVLTNARFDNKEITQFLFTDWIIEPAVITKYDVTLSMRDVMLGGTKNKQDFTRRVSERVIDKSLLFLRTSLVPQNL